jgi:CubicO group peptidase (beta-lactamase class C family)
MTGPCSFCFALAVAGLLCHPATAQTPATEAKVRLIENGLLPLAAERLGVTASIGDRMRAYGVPGISVAVVDDGKIVWAKGYGAVDSSSRRPVTTATLFQAASISKPLSAMGALVLVQKGLVDLDTDVNEALASWTIPVNDMTRASPVTLRTLLNHTSGADHSASGQIEIVSPPGEMFSYSAAGYEVVQRLVMDVSGKSFEEFMQSEVLRPLGMTSSTFAQPPPAPLLSLAATGHYAGGRPIPGRFRSMSVLTAAGLWSTPTDIAKYLLYVQSAYAARAQAPLKTELVRQMLSPGIGNRGLGPAISGSGTSLRFGHDGFNEGFESSLIAYVNQGRGVVVMANSGFAFMLLKELLDSVRRAYDWPAYGPTTQQPPAADMGQQLVAPISARTLTSIVGTYELDDIVTIKIYRERRRLLLDWPGSGVAELFATPDGRLFCPQLTFSEIGTPWLRAVEDHGGVVTRILIEDDESAAFRRVN